MGRLGGVAAGVAVLTLLAGGVATALPSDAAGSGGQDHAPAEGGNPFVAGWYGDPGTARLAGAQWVFATAVRRGGTAALDAFSSTDLIHWSRHPGVLTVADVPWAHGSLRAAAPIEYDGRFFLYFSADDGVGVAVAERPEGPYADALGRPLIAGTGAAEPAVLSAADGRAYLYLGGGGRVRVAALGAGLTSLGALREVTPAGYTDGAHVFRRGGRYYLLWSGGHAVAAAPTGPFAAAGPVLRADPAIAAGAEGGGVLTTPGTDAWYLVYARRPPGETDPEHRVLGYDRLTFAADGTIRPLSMGISYPFGDGSALGWRIYGGGWSVSRGRFVVEAASGAKALLDTDLTDLTLDADVTITGSAGDAGVVFRVTKASKGQHSFSGYYAGVSTTGSVLLTRAGPGWTPLASVPLDVTRGRRFHLRVVAAGPSIRVYVDDLAVPRISVTDDAHSGGATGVRVDGPAAAFDNVAVVRP